MFNLWFARLNKFSIFKIFFLIIRFIIWPLIKLYGLFGQFKFLRWMLFFLALFYGIDLDNLTLINNFSFTWAGISGFLLHLVGESLNWLAHLFHQISMWLWDKSFDFPRFNKDLKTL